MSAVNTLTSKSAGHDSELQQRARTVDCPLCRSAAGAKCRILHSRIGRDGQEQRYVHLDRARKAGAL